MLIKKLLYRFFELLIVFLFFYLLKYNIITMDRLLRLLIIMVCILLYLFFVKLLKIFIKYYLEERVDEKFIKKNYELAKKIVILLNNFRNIINPSFLIILKFYEKIFFFFRYINWKFEKNEKFRRILYIIIRNWILFPILRIFIIFYNVLKRWRKRVFIEILSLRFEGLIMSILLYSNIYDYINYYYLLLFIYIFLVSPEYWPKKFKKKNYIYIWSTSFIFLLEDRSENTLIGNIIDILIKNFRIEIKDILISRDWFKYNDKDIFLIISYIQYVEFEGFEKEVKNKPSLLLFRKLYLLFNDLNKYFFGKIKLENDPEWKNSDELKEVIRLYEIEKSRCKRVIFYVWEVEEWLNIKRSKVYIDFYRMSITFILDDKIYNNKDSITINNFSIEGKEANFMDFKDYFNRVYKDMLWNQIITKKEDKNFRIILGNAFYTFATYMSFGNDEIRELFKEEMEEFIKEMEEEWEKKKS